MDSRGLPRAGNQERGAAQGLGLSPPEPEVPSSSHFLLTPALRWVTLCSVPAEPALQEGSHGWTQLEALPFQNWV